MKIAMTGWGGFLATKLRQASSQIEWVEYPAEADALIHLGSPTFTHAELFEHDAQVMHQYVRETIKLFDRFDGPILFASTTGVDDIRLDHKGTTSYNLAKLFLENYVLNECDSPTVLRIGTIVSSDPADIREMKPNRIQPQMLQGIMPTEWEDCYLFVEDFVNTTLDVILNKTTGIVEYPLKTLTLAQLKQITK
jgi:nucleoside-diphosphate-sugar epimerase